MRTKIIFHLFLLTTLSWVVTGCGYVAISTKNFDYKSLGVGPHRGQLTIGAATHLPYCSSSFIADNWGKPDERVRINENTSLWTYYHGLKWVGASPVALIPLPIFAPVGKEKIHFGMQGNNVIYIQHETTQRDVVLLPLLTVYNIPGSVYQTFSDLGCQFRQLPLQQLPND
jgi:hypothetical protein